MCHCPHAVDEKAEPGDDPRARRPAGVETGACSGRGAAAAAAAAGERPVGGRRPSNGIAPPGCNSGCHPVARHAGSRNADVRPDRFRPPATRRQRTARYPRRCCHQSAAGGFSAKPERGFDRECPGAAFSSQTDVRAPDLKNRLNWGSAEKSFLVGGATRQDSGKAAGRRILRCCVAGRGRSLCRNCICRCFSMA
jgi:hypothetical protein